MRVYEAALRVASSMSGSQEALAEARLLFECLDRDALLREVPGEAGASLESLREYLGGLLTGCRVSGPEGEALKNYDVPLAMAVAGDVEGAVLVMLMLVVSDLYKEELAPLALFDDIDKLIEALDDLAYSLCLSMKERIKSALIESMKKYLEEEGLRPES